MESKKEIVQGVTAVITGAVLGFVAYKLFRTSIEKIGNKKGSSNFSSACGCGA